MSLRPSWELYGDALLDYQRGNREAVINNHCQIGELVTVPVSFYFRSPGLFTDSEIVALDCSGDTVLELGSGAGSHALALQQQGKDVIALDWCSAAVTVMKERGVLKTVTGDFFSYQGQQVETLLLLMNGLGIIGQIEQFKRFLGWAKAVLLPAGFILCDSCDLTKLFPHDRDLQKDGGKKAGWEVQYTLEYQEEKGKPFSWFFIDPDSLYQQLEQAGWFAQILFQDSNGHYLMRLTPDPA